MSSRAVAVWGAGVTVVLAAVSAALINELHAGVAWRIAAIAVVLLSAGISAWLAYRSSGPTQGDRLAAGAIKAGRDIRGGATTKVRGRVVNRSPTGAAGDDIGLGAVKAGRDIDGDASTDVDS